MAWAPQVPCGHLGVSRRTPSASSTSSSNIVSIGSRMRSRTRCSRLSRQGLGSPWRNSTPVLLSAMRHTRIYEKALLLDAIVRAYRRSRGRKSFPHKMVGQIIPLLFPGSKRLGRGAFKTAYRVSSTARNLVLKTARSRYIRRDLELYKTIPSRVRNRYFAKIYWGTKYCLLQKYGKEKNVPQKIRKKLKAKGKEFGLSDVRDDNIRWVDRRFKIVDANLR